MCGIVGYIGDKDACPFLLSGLQRLEYRGYDSAGVATLKNSDSIRITKVSGRVAELEAALANQTQIGSLGIGHTRWATHGIANQTNAHPHVGGQGLLSLAHNGVIENYEALKTELISKGYQFHSQTDSEVVAHLVADCLKKQQLPTLGGDREKGRFASAVL